MGIGGADGPRIGTGRSGKSSGSNKGSEVADTGRSHTARSLRHESPLTAAVAAAAVNDTERGAKKQLSPTKSLDNLAGA